MLVGYARVSSDGQSVETQTQALKTAECERIFSEKISGAIADRRQLPKAIEALAPGDALVVTKRAADRDVRSTARSSLSPGPGSIPLHLIPLHLA
jgi:DNA invertase Pin-like site-specific DNA recombinase